MGPILLTAWMTALAASGAPSTASASEPLPYPDMRVAQMMIERRVVIRVAPQVRQVRPRENLRAWREKSAPRCFQINSLAGIVISKPDSIDMVLRGGKIIRARLERGCPSIDFYSGFYLKPTEDGRLCEDRDIIHSRTGGACEIDKFKSLSPPKP